MEADQVRLTLLPFVVAIRFVGTVGGVVSWMVMVYPCAPGGGCLGHPWPHEPSGPVTRVTAAWSDRLPHGRFCPLGWPLLGDAASTASTAYICGPGRTLWSVKLATVGPTLAMRVPSR